jgi:hypothetical protein
MLALPQGHIFIDNLSEAAVLDDKPMLLFEFDLMQKLHAQTLCGLKIVRLQTAPDVLARAQMNACLI